MTITDRITDIEALLSSYEARPINKTTEGINHARQEISFGQQLGRLQFERPNPMRARLTELVILGKATPDEVMALAAEIARQGMFTNNHPQHDDSR